MQSVLGSGEAGIDVSVVILILIKRFCDIKSPLGRHVLNIIISFLVHF